MPLTRQEKVAGKAFRETQQRLLRERCEADPPTFVVPHFLAIFRHLCERRDNVSTALELREVYIPSPAYDVFDMADDAWYAFPADGTILMPTTAAMWHDNAPEQSAYVPAGRFGFLYREGRCRRCGKTARSDRGRLVTSDRPPLHPRKDWIPMTDKRKPAQPDDSTPADPQTPQSRSIPGPTYEHPDEVNDPVDEQYGGADRQDDGVHNSDH